MLIALLILILVIGLFLHDVGLAAAVLSVAIMALVLVGLWLLLATLLDLFGAPMSRLISVGVLALAGYLSALFVRTPPPEDEA